MDGLEGGDIEITATQARLVCYDYGLETGIVQAFYGAGIAIGRLQKLQDDYDAELVPESGQSAYALLSTSNGNVGVVGGSDQVEELIDRSKPDRYVKALNAL